MSVPGWPWETQPFSRRYRVPVVVMLVVLVGTSLALLVLFWVAGR